jgi:hypothetical protein
MMYIYHLDNDGGGVSGNDADDVSDLSVQFRLLVAVHSIRD